MNKKLNRATEQKSRRKIGFTLLEVLVAFLIMAFVMTTVLSAMKSFILTSQTLSLVREMQKEAHFSLLRVSDKIRNESIDFSEYGAGGKCDSLTLGLSQKICLGGGYFFEYDSDKKNIFMGQGSGAPSPLFSKEIIVKKAAFEVSPDRNPYDSENWGNQLYQRQPLVTLQFLLVSRKDEKVTLNLETSISSRVYK